MEQLGLGAPNPTENLDLVHNHRSQHGSEWDIAVDGTTLTAKSLPDAVSVLGVSPRGTDGALLKGVRFESHRIITYSLSMRSRSGTVRLIEGRHDPERSFLVNY